MHKQKQILDKILKTDTETVEAILAWEMGDVQKAPVKTGMK